MMNTADEDIIRRLREHAAELRLKVKALEDAADTIEGVERSPTHRTEIRPGPTVDEVKAAMRGRKVRIPELARNMKASENVLKEIVKPENGFVRGERGWWYIAKDGGHDETTTENT